MFLTGLLKALATKKRYYNIKSKASTHKNSVYKLSCCWVFEKVFPFRFEREQVAWNPTVCHLGKRIVNKASVQTSDKRTCKERGGVDYISLYTEREATIDEVNDET